MASYEAHIRGHVEKVLNVITSADPPPPAHGWPREVARPPVEVLRAIEEAMKTRVDFSKDTGARDSLLSSYLQEVWLGEAPHDAAGADTVAAVLHVIEHPEATVESVAKFFGGGDRAQRLARKVLNLHNGVMFLLNPDLSPIERSLDLDLVLKLHSIVGASVIPGAGQLRTHDVAPCGERKVYLPHGRVEGRLRTLLAVTSAMLDEAEAPELNRAKAIAVASVFFSEFLLIHPFVNGNGRVARLLLNYTLRRFVVIPFTLGGGADGRSDAESHSYFVRERVKYIDVLRARNDTKIPPSLLADYVMKSIELTLGVLSYITMAD